MFGFICLYLKSKISNFLIFFFPSSEDFSFSLGPKSPLLGGGAAELQWGDLFCSGEHQQQIWRQPSHSRATHVSKGERLEALFLSQALRSVCVGGKPFLSMCFHHLFIKPCLSLLLQLNSRDQEAPGRWCWDVFCVPDSLCDCGGEMCGPCRADLAAEDPLLGAGNGQEILFWHASCLGEMENALGFDYLLCGLYIT